MTHELAMRIIEETLRRFGRAKPPWNEYVSVARELFPDDMAKLGQSFERQGMIKWIKDAARRVVNTGEDDPNAPTVQLSLLPGRPAPRILNLGSDMEPDMRRFVDSIAEDIRFSIEKRKRKMGQIGGRVEDLQLKLEWLLEHQLNSSETVGEVCTRLSGGIGPAPGADGPEVRPQP